MRKWIVLVLVLLVLFFGAVYVFIPNTITVKNESRISVNANAFTREFLREGTGHLLPTEKEEENLPENSFKYGGNNFTLVEKKFTSLVYVVKRSNDSMLAELVVIPFRTDTVALSFIGVTKAGFNPVSRIAKLIWAKKLASDFESLMQRLKSHYGDTSMIYGYNIRKVLVTDTTLISTSVLSKKYPDNNMIYSLVDKLNDFAQKNNAQSTGSPMLNITVTADSSYLTRVALPLNKRLNDEGNIKYKWMMNKGNILIAEVKGGPGQINKAMAAFKIFVTDHQLSTVAIPFQSLVTDRRTEPDTAKWVTKIYWPVI